jgi:GH35 family endo-1,4-beta-xylanase
MHEQLLTRVSAMKTSHILVAVRARPTRSGSARTEAVNLPTPPVSTKAPVSADIACLSRPVASKPGPIARLRSSVRVLLMAVAFGAAAGTLPAQVVSSDFEDGTLQGWTPFGSPTLTNSTEAAHTGTHSLKTTNRTASFNGPSLDLQSQLLPGATYQISGWVRLVSGSDTVRFTVQHGTGGNFAGVAQGVAGNTAWVQLQGTFTRGVGDSVVRLYLESNNAASEYYLDDVVITEISPPPTPVVTHDFEDGTTQGWRPRFGSPIVTNTTDAAHAGTRSIVTTNRTQAFNGPALDVGSILQPDNIYQFGGWVRLVPGQTLTSPVTIKFTMQVDFSDGSGTQFIEVTPSQTVTDTAWVHLQGNFSFGGTNVSALTLYGETNGNGATASFYLDDFTIALAFEPPPPFDPPGPPIAEGKDKFLGSAYSNAQAPNFEKYWNQVTPENGGKWGTVEGTRDVMVWTEADAAYALARENGFPFRFHTLVWGAQQPAWMAMTEITDPEERAQAQLAEIHEWFAAAAEHFTPDGESVPDIEMIDVVNEPLHSRPVYADALGGDGATGWDWVIKSFELARQYFPESQLTLNDFGLANDQSAVQRYNEIVELLKTRGLIDAVGLQGHAFNTRVPAATIDSNVSLLASKGLPLFVTELDIDGPSDEIQLADYMRIFPVFWEHPAVAGVTLWGWRIGHWRTAQGAYLAYTNGAEKPALVWLREYVNTPIVIAEQSYPIDGGSCNTVATALAMFADGTALTTQAEWQIVGGDGAGLFAIQSTTGTISIPDPLALDFNRTSYTLIVTAGSVTDGSGTFTSEPVEITVTIAANLRIVHKKRHVVIVPKLDVPDHLAHGDCIGGIAP